MLKRITFKTTTASSSLQLPLRRERSHRKTSESICFKNTFLATLLGGFRDIWYTFSCREGKIAGARWAHLSGLMMPWPCHCCCYYGEKKYRVVGGTSPSGLPTNHTPRYTPWPFQSSGGINQDNSLHTLNPDPTTTHTNIRWSVGGGLKVKGWGWAQRDAGWSNSEAVRAC